MDLRFSEELPGYRFLESAKWRPLFSPSTASEAVLKLMGVPLKELTFALGDEVRKEGDDYLELYLQFDHDPGWTVGFIFTLRDAHNKPTDSLSYVVMKPKAALDFSRIKFPETYTATTFSTSFTWTEYVSAHGPIYSVCGAPPYERGEAGEVLLDVLGGREGDLKVVRYRLRK